MSDSIYACNSSVFERRFIPERVKSGDLMRGRERKGGSWMKSLFKYSNELLSRIYSESISIMLINAIWKKILFSKVVMNYEHGCNQAV